MDQLLFLALFVLFSVVSTLLERRRRRQSLEEARRRHETAQRKDPPPAEDREEEEENEGNWPWPDIFEPQPVPRPKRAEVKCVPAQTVSAEAPASETQPGEGKYRRAEEEMREMERRVQEMEQRTREADLRSMEEYRLMEEQAASRMGAGAGQRRPARAAEGARARRQNWGLTPREARRAFVYAEIIGPPKSERME